MSWEPAQNDWRAGDVIVSVSSRGYVVSRVLDLQTFGPWWEIVGVEATHSNALARACEIAESTASRVLVFESGRFHEVTLAGSYLPRR